LEVDLADSGFPDAIRVRSRAVDRDNYLRRPDLGRELDPACASDLAAHRRSWDIAFVIADGLSSRAVQRHAAPLLSAVGARLPAEGWKISPPVLAEGGRVALGDACGLLLGAAMVAVLIGERPGLSSPDSLGVYLTFDPRPGRTDAERNCISNIRPEGLSYETGAAKLCRLAVEARRRRLTGVSLKEPAGLPAP
jgi:ethanolamine ammonia-lyase small subunit